MSQAHMLTRHQDIRSWVIDRRGIPAIAQVRDRFGEGRSQLLLRFVRSQAGKVDEGMSPCSWSAWLAELDRQQLALKITPTGDCELVPRSSTN
jgi:hypothetical protein